MLRRPDRPPLPPHPVAPASQTGTKPGSTDRLELAPRFVLSAEYPVSYQQAAVKEARRMMGRGGILSDWGAGCMPRREGLFTRRYPAHGLLVS
jgi:hypothetical protein